MIDLANIIQVNLVTGQNSFLGFWLKERKKISKKFRPTTKCQIEHFANNVNGNDNYKVMPFFFFLLPLSYSTL